MSTLWEFLISIFREYRPYSPLSYPFPMVVQGRGNTLMQRCCEKLHAHILLLKIPSYLTMHKLQVNSFQCDLQKPSFTSFHILHWELTTQFRSCNMITNKEKKGRKESNRVICTILSIYWVTEAKTPRNVHCNSGLVLLWHVQCRVLD